MKTPPTPSEPVTLSKPPLPIRLALLASAAAAMALFGWSLYAATIAAPATVWAGLGFSLIGLVSAGFAIALGLGRFANGFGIATLSIAGAVATCAVLAWLDLRANLAAVPELARLLNPWLITTAGTGVIVGGLAALAVLLRSAASWKYAASGLAGLGAFGGMIGAMRGPGSSLLSRWEDGPEALRVTLLLIIAFVGLVLLSAGGHLLIRAFEVTTQSPSSRRRVKPAA
ncbi:MAG: hypothetical protein AAF297_01015 [Planctomycetota bacterium]